MGLESLWNKKKEIGTAAAVAALGAYDAATLAGADHMPPKEVAHSEQVQQMNPQEQEAMRQMSPSGHVVTVKEGVATVEINPALAPKTVELKQPQVIEVNPAIAPKVVEINSGIQPKVIEVREPITNVDVSTPIHDIKAPE